MLKIEIFIHFLREFSPSLVSGRRNWKGRIVVNQSNVGWQDGSSGSCLQRLVALAVGGNLLLWYPHPQAPVCSAFASRGKTKRPKGLLCFQHLAPYAHLYPGIEQWAWILQLCSAYTHMHTTYSKCPTSAQSWVLSWDRGRQSWQKSRYSVRPWHWLDSIFSLLLKLRGRHEASTGCHRDASATPRQTLFHWVASWPHFAFPGG